MSCLCHVTFSYSFFLSFYLCFISLLPFVCLRLLCGAFSFLFVWKYFTYTDISPPHSDQLQSSKTNTISHSAMLLFLFFFCQHLPHPVACIVLDAHTSFYDIYFYGGYLCSGPFFLCKRESPLKY